MINPEIYSFEKGKIILIDPELGLHFQETFSPLLIPPNPKHLQKLSDGFVIKMISEEEGIGREFVIEKKGRFEGQSLIYYPKGKVKAECYYLKGELHGPSTFYKEDGGILTQTWFIKGKRQGKSKVFYLKGSLFSLQRFVNGVWHGLQEFYYENGTHKTIMNYHKGKLKGKVLVYSGQGQIEREMIF